MSSSKNLDFEKNSFLHKSNSAFIEQMYLKFINKNKDLPESWLNYFEGIGDEIKVIANEINGPSWGPEKTKVNIDELQKKIDEEENNSLNNEKIGTSEKFNFQLLADSNKDSISAVALIRAYRLRGHLLADLDPLGMRESEYLDELALAYPENVTIYRKPKNSFWKSKFEMMSLVMKSCSCLLYT